MSFSHHSGVKSPSSIQLFRNDSCLRCYNHFVSNSFSLIAGSNTREIAELESRHAAEVERLRTKLKWYAETQALLDRDTLTLKKKEEEIDELKETVARLQAQHGQTVAEKKQRGVERATDAKRIQDLERQVKECFILASFVL